jgi:transcriptional regulator with XRE-family HTH domain
MKGHIYRMTAERRWDLLSLHIADRAAALGLRTQLAIAERTGISRAIINDLLNGRRTSYSKRTIAYLEHGLGWDVGSVEAVLAGDQPRDRSTPTNRSA